MRYFLQLSYNGSPYCGWQRQPHHASVQQTLEEALSTILRTKIAITGAGRTDTGVHAKIMYAHFDLDNINDTQYKLIKQLPYKLNSILPKSIAIHQLFEVNANAHARFDAINRAYKYYIHQHKNPFIHKYSYHLKTPLNVEAMNTAAQLLIGKHDFQCFSKVKTDVHTYFCDIDFAKWDTTAEGLVFHIKADRFLRNMVRAIVGTLLLIGQEKKEPQWILEVMASKNRNVAGTSVPAHALFLTEVSYPETIHYDDKNN